MIAVTAQMRVLVAIEPTDFRRGIDGLARLVRAEFGSDPFSGCVFVFRNRRANAVKILAYDGRGYWLCQKRLSSGKFCFWPKGQGGQRARALEAHELAVLVAGGDFAAVRAAPVWRRLA